MVVLGLPVLDVFTSLSFPLSVVVIHRDNRSTRDVTHQEPPG